MAERQEAVPSLEDLRRMKRQSAAATALAVLCITAIGAGSPALAAQPAAELDTKALDSAILIQDGENATGQLGLVAAPDETWRGSDGDKVTQRSIPADAHFRIGSVSKVFEATIVLQLAAEHRVDLNRSIQSYLPGVLPPKKFLPITVRQLLNHTSGLPRVDEGAPDPTPDEIIQDRYRYQTFEQIVWSTLHPIGRPAPGRHFDPGTEQEYNSFNYRVAGLLIERITGTSFARQVEARIIKPLGLHDTSVPERNPLLPTPYLHGYLVNSQGKPVDVSAAEGDPSSMISTPSDLDKFIVALFRGRLLPPAQQSELFTLPRDASGALLCDPATAPIGTQCLAEGLMATGLPGGLVVWGKTGHDLGYASGVFATRDLQRHGVYAVGLRALDNGDAPALAARLAIAAFTPPTT
jgi:D-alanyl-D-alanine carboxypeptidase